MEQTWNSLFFVPFCFMEQDGTKQKTPHVWGEVPLNKNT
jgi:hypothetical protein